MTTPGGIVMAACMMTLAGCDQRIPEYAQVGTVAACVEHTCRVITDDGRRVTVSGPAAPGDRIVRYGNWNNWMVRQ